MTYDCFSAVHCLPSDSKSTFAQVGDSNWNGAYLMAAWILRQFPMTNHHWYSFCKCLNDIWRITIYDLRKCLLCTFAQVSLAQLCKITCDFNTGLTMWIHSWFDSYFYRGENKFSIVWKHPLIKSVCFPFSFHLILFGSSLCIFCTLLMILMSDQLYEITLNNIFMILMYTHLCEITHDFIPTVLAVHTRFHRS